MKTNHDVFDPPQRASTLDNEAVFLKKILILTVHHQNSIRLRFSRAQKVEKTFAADFFVRKLPRQTANNPDKPRTFKSDYLLVQYFDEASTDR